MLQKEDATVKMVISNNELKTLPDEFGNLSLISLWLSENQFKEIPECIFRYKTIFINYPCHIRPYDIGDIT